MDHEDERTAELYAALVAMVDNQAQGYDTVEMLDQLARRCVSLLPVEAAGVLLANDTGVLRVVASTNESATLIELLEMQDGQGPSRDAFRDREIVSAPHLAQAHERWPRFADAATHAGFELALAIPLQLRAQPIGVLALLGRRGLVLSEDDIGMVRVLTQMATIGMLNHWAMQRKELLAEELQNAHDTRLIIERAKGVLAERAGVDMATAFQLLRGHARSHNRRLAEVCADLIEGRLALPLVTTSAHPRRR